MGDQLILLWAQDTRWDSPLGSEATAVDKTRMGCTPAALPTRP